MKKTLLLLALLGIFITTRSQNFEGTIKWSFKMEVTDPAMKTKMAEAQQKLNDPATQAKMKEMQAKMNDPQFKAMMESNPQMKAQMDNMMKMSQGGDMNSMMPKSMTLKLKNGNSLTTMEGGMMPMEILHLKDKDETIRLDRQNKTYMIMPQGGGGGRGPGGAEGMKPTVTKTSETAKILNYTCTKYVVQMTEGSHTITQNIWTTTDIKDIDMKSFTKQGAARGQQIFYEGMDGVPLKVEASTPEGNMVMEVTDLKKETLDASNFAIPSDFKEQKMFGR